MIGQEFFDEVVSFSLGNPTGTFAQLRSHLNTVLGIDFQNIDVAVPAIQQKVVDSRAIPAPGTWPSLRTFIQTLGQSEAFNWFMEYVLTKSFLMMPEIKLAASRENLKQLDLKLSHLQDLLSAADEISTADALQTEVVQTAKNSIQSSTLLVSSSRFTLQNRISELEAELS